MTKVSVIVPTCGAPTLLAAAIDSVFAQTSGDWELITVDDNDPDTADRRETQAVLAPYLADGRVRYLLHPHNRGGSAARNTGLAAAAGEYVAFLDADDAYRPARLARCSALLDAQSESVAGVYTGVEFRRNGRRYHVTRSVRPGRFAREALACTFPFGTGSNLFLRRSCAEALGGFDEAFARHQDYELLARLFRSWELAAIPEPLVVKNNDNRFLPDARRLIAVKEQYLAKFAFDIEALDAASQAYIRRSHYLQIAEAALREGDRVLAGDYYRKARGYGALSPKQALRRLALEGRCVRTCSV